MIDLITVVFAPELESLRLQARSIDLYVDNVDSIVIVINDNSINSDTILRQWWGRYSDQVQIIPRNQFGTEWSQNGWVSQQALKLLASGQCASPWAVILDAKTIFVKDFELNEVRPTVGTLDIYPVFDPSRLIANTLFGVDLQKQLGPGGVPFVINTQQTREMIAWIEHRTGQSFADWFQLQGRLTEFILYSAWILYRTGSLNSIYDIDYTNIVPVNVCHSEVERFEQKLAQMPDATTVSIHRNAWSQLGPDQQQQYMNLLQAKGIA